MSLKVKQNFRRPHAIITKSHVAGWTSDPSPGGNVFLVCFNGVNTQGVGIFLGGHSRVRPSYETREQTDL